MYKNNWLQILIFQFQKQLQPQFQKLQNKKQCFSKEKNDTWDSMKAKATR